MRPKHMHMRMHTHTVARILCESYTYILHYTRTLNTYHSCCVSVSRTLTLCMQTNTHLTNMQMPGYKYADVCFAASTLRL